MKTPPVFHYSSFKTPAGRFSVAVDCAGSVVAAAFGGQAALQGRLRTGTLVADPPGTAAARRQVEAWFLGKRHGFSVGVSPAGTPFQRKVWAALRRIPYGRTLTYGDLARRLGSSPRAVGRANATNPVCLIIPCHRVIGSDGSLTGYAFGNARKSRLLKLEGA
jgi:methylated-DNA-[protein]-cysteine S-methyltransferase